MLKLCCAYLIYLHHRQALADKDGSTNHEMDFLAQYSEILNIEGHWNLISGSNVTAILLSFTLWLVSFSSIKWPILLLKLPNIYCNKKNVLILGLICPHYNFVKNCMTRQLAIFFLKNTFELFGFCGDKHGNIWHYV